MKYLILILILFHPLLSICQMAPVEVTQAIQNEIQQDIEKKIPDLKKRLEGEDRNPIEIAFILDTFRFERFFSKWIELDYRDFGMRDACYITAELYDSLMNIYYKKLLITLKGNDKEILIQAQNAWIVFRDSNAKLIEILSGDEYGGGGTSSALSNASQYLEVVKDRTIDLYRHYKTATRIY